MGTIEMSNFSQEEALSALNALTSSGLPVEVQPELRYLTGQSREWVVPFHVDRARLASASKNPPITNVLSLEFAREKRSNKIQSLRGDR